MDRIVIGPESLVSSVVPPAPQPAAKRSKRNHTKERLMAMVYPNLEADATGLRSHDITSNFQPHLPPPQIQKYW